MIDYKSIDLKDYEIPDDMTQELLEKRLMEPLFRICNLYCIRNDDGVYEKFVPNWPQRVVLYYIYVLGRQRIAIPKARKLGFSTLAEVIAFDRAYFCKGQESAVIERSQPDAWEKKKIVDLMWEKLDPDLKNGAGLIRDNKAEIAWSNGGSVMFGLSVVGKTPTFLHISEWGIIAYNDPERSAEIKGGMLQSVSGSEAVIFAEGTFRGGRGGDWYQIVNSGLKVAEKHRTAKDWTVLFFPWYLDSRYELDGDCSQIDAETHRFFEEKEKLTGHKFTDRQKLWYYKEKQPQNSGRWVKREFPTTIDDMWSVREDGQIYASFMDAAALAGRINDDIRHYDMLPVYAALDIGAPENTKLVIWQEVGDRKTYIGAYSGNGETLATPAQWWKFMSGLGYLYGGVFLPHDAEHNSWHRLFLQAGCSVAVVLKRPMSEWDNIVEAQTQFSRCEFKYSDSNDDGCCVYDEDGNDIGLTTALECFHCKIETASGKTARETPVHDWSSHFSTAFGYSHQAAKDGLLVDRSAIPVKQGLVQKPRVSMGRRRR